MDRREALENIPFPPVRPEFAGKWRAVQIEPIAGSGERLTVAVALLVNERVQIRIAPRIDRMNCLYGAQADKFVKTIHIALNYVRDFVRSAEDFHQCPAKILGGSIFFGAPRKFLANSIDESFIMAFRNFSSFAEWKDEPKDLLGNEAISSKLNLTPSTHKQLVKDVETAFIRKVPMSADRFNKEYKIASRNRPTRIDYVGEKIIAKFSILRETKLEHWISKGKGDILDLKLHKDFDAIGNIGVNHELLIFAPPATSANSKLHNEVVFAIEELEEAAKKTNIDAYTLHSAQEIGEYLAQREAA